MQSLEELIRILISGDDETANQAIPEIASYGNDALTELEKLLKKTNPDIRWWAIRTAAEIDLPKTTRLLIMGLNDADTAVQQCAALGFRERPNPASIPDLIPLINHQDKMLARLAGDALVAQGHAATTALIDVVQNGKFNARVEAVRALALIRDYAAVRTLFYLLDDESTVIEHWAQEGLARMGIGMTFFHPG